MAPNTTLLTRSIRKTLTVALIALVALAAASVGGLERQPASAGPVIVPPDHLVVSDLNARAVFSFSTEDVMADTLSDDPLLEAPNGIARLPEGGYVVTSSRAGTPGAVVKIEKDGTTTAIVEGLPNRGARGIAVDENGDFVVGNSECFGTEEDCTVMRVTPDGDVTHVFAFPGGEQPGAIAIDENGDYIVGTTSGGLWRVTPAGAGELIAGAPDLFNAFGVAIDEDGNYLVTDGNSDIVRKVTPDGDVSTYAEDASWGRLIGIAIGPQGDVVVSDEANGAIYRISEGGPSEEIYSGDPLSSPNGLILLGPDRPGDVNCDKSITSVDALLVLQLEAGLIVGLDCNLNADVNVDDATDPLDAALILQFVAALIDMLPPT